MDLDFSIVEDIRLALLIDDTADAVLPGKRFDNGFAWPGDPDIDVAALAATRVRVQPRQRRPLQDAAMQAKPIEYLFKLFLVAHVPCMDLSDLSGEAVPTGHDVLRWQLLCRQAVYGIIKHTYQRLQLGHGKHHAPILGRRILLKGGFAAQEDQ